MESIILLLAVAGGALLLMAAVKARCIQTFVNLCYSLSQLVSSCISSYATHLEPYIPR